MRRQRFWNDCISWRYGAAIVLTGLIIPISTAQELEEDAALQSQPHTYAQPTNLERNDKGRYVIKSGVQTLETAIEMEKDSVDWYAWYLSVREYITLHNGLKCLPGTPIIFHKSGKIEASTLDPRCLLSIDNMRFPLPKKSKLEAVMFPVRSNAEHPAPPSEVYRRTGGYK